MENFCDIDKLYGEPFITIQIHFIRTCERMPRWQRNH